MCLSPAHQPGPRTPPTGPPLTPPSSRASPTAGSGLTELLERCQTCRTGQGYLIAALTLHQGSDRMWTHYIPWSERECRTESDRRKWAHAAETVREVEAWGNNKKGTKTEEVNRLLTPIKGALLWPVPGKLTLAFNNKKGKKIKKKLLIWAVQT